MGSPVAEDNTSYDEQLSSVLDACDCGDVKRLGEFIISGGELRDILDRRKRNALHHCVRRGDEKPQDAPRNLFEQLDRIKCARIIVKTDSSFLSQLDSQGHSPMHLAVLNNDLEFIRAMNEFRPPLDVRTTSAGSQTCSSGSQVMSGIGGRTVIHLAVLHGHMEILKSLLDMDVANCINALDEQGASALHYAVQLPNDLSGPAIESLVEHGKADLNTIDSHGRTALSWAATIGAFEAVTQLLKLGAKINVADECGLTPLHCAASRGNRDIVQSMLSWISVANMDDPSKMAAFRDVADKDGCTPIFYSVTMGHPEVTKCLLDYGANVQVQDNKGRSLAHCLARLGATHSGHTDDKSQQDKENECRLLAQMTDLLAAGLNPWITTNSGAAPLHEACLLRNVPFVCELAKLPTFAEHVDTRDAHGHTALHLVVAASWSSDEAGLELCECLLRNGANVNASTLLPQGGAVTPLDLALMNEKEENVKRGKVRILLESHGAKRFDQLCHVSKDTLNLGPVSEERPGPGDVKASGSGPGGRKLVKSASTMTNATRIKLIDTATEPRKTGDTPSPRQQNPKDTDGNREIGTQIITAQTSRGSQTEFEFSTQLSRPGSKKNSPRTNQSGRREVGTQAFVDDGGPRAAGSVSSLASKRSASSRRSTNSSSVSCRVDTPLSSATDTVDGDGPPRQTVKAKGRVRSVVSRSKANSPYSQAYLERELPGILKRYLSQEDQLISPLTGRSRMPKPTISPYLIPLVPCVNPLSGVLRKPIGRSGLTTHSRSPKRQPLAAHNNPDHTMIRGSRHKTPPSRLPPPTAALSRSTTTASRSSHLQSPSSTGTRNSCGNAANSQNRLHTSDRQFVQQLIRQAMDHPEPGHSKQTCPSENKARKARSKSRPGTQGKTRSAMGGELSPVGIREESDDATGSHRNSFPSRPNSISQKRSQRGAVAR